MAPGLWPGPSKKSLSAVHSYDLYHINFTMFVYDKNKDTPFGIGSIVSSDGSRICCCLQNRIKSFSLKPEEGFLFHKQVKFSVPLF